jgi:hypothetical protein
MAKAKVQEQSTPEQAVEHAQPIITPTVSQDEAVKAARENVRAALLGKKPGWPVPMESRVAFFQQAENDLVKQSLALELDYAQAVERQDEKVMAEIEMQASKVYGGIQTVRNHLARLAVNLKAGV